MGLIKNKSLISSIFYFMHDERFRYLISSMARVDFLGTMVLNLLCELMTLIGYWPRGIEITIGESVEMLIRKEEVDSKKYTNVPLRLSRF